MSTNTICKYNTRQTSNHENQCTVFDTQPQSYFCAMHAISEDRESALFSRLSRAAEMNILVPATFVHSPRPHPVARTCGRVNICTLFNVIRDLVVVSKWQEFDKHVPSPIIVKYCSSSIRITRLPAAWLYLSGGIRSPNDANLRNCSSPIILDRMRQSWLLAAVHACCD